MNDAMASAGLRMAPAELIQQLISNVETVFQGKTEVVTMTVTALLARGHVLLEDVPGVGKTTLAHAVARSVGADFQRVQFTSDLLPTDILGVTIFNSERSSFQLKRGPIFTNVLLADEINRTTPRTQSALLEAMAEGRVSIDDQTHDLPTPFAVIATQNPLDYHGTYPLPESQLDRFLVRLSIGYPSPMVERDLLLKRRAGEPVEELAAALDLADLRGLQEVVSTVRMEPSLVDYIMAVVQATRRSPALRTGVSTRGALALTRACRAHALVSGRDYCIPDDITRLLIPVLAHRVSLAGAGGALGSSRTESEALIEEIASKIDVPI